MSKLEKGLKEWVALGFISEAQAVRIRDHESVKPEGSWILTGFLILGAVIVGIGVISLIAANWNDIPDFMKLAGDFLLLAGLAFWTIQSWESKKIIQFEVVLLFFMILCLASIGLISQVFHTGGKFYQALMFWSLITVGAGMAAKHVFVPFIWAGAFLTGIAFTAHESAVMQAIFQKNILSVFMALPLLCAGFTVVSKALAGESGSTRAFRAWTLIAGLVGLTVAEFHFGRTHEVHALMPYIPGYTFAAIAAFGIWQSLEYRRVQKILLVVALGVFLIPFHASFSSIAHAILTIVVIGLMAAFLASQKERRLFQGFLLLLGVRFLGLYFQALGGLATTGVGLIISGALVIAMAVLWNKYRKVLAVWAEKWVQ
jgi:hypothetical protein